MKKHLDQTKAPRSMAELQGRLDAFVTYYNEVRPHRGIGRSTPRAAFEARVKAGPMGKPVRNAGAFRIRNDRVDADGKVTLRHAGVLRHLAVGRVHRRTYVMLLIDDRDVRVLSAEGDGELLATFRLDRDRIYQPRLMT